MGTARNVFPNSWKSGQALIPIYPAASERLKIVLSSDSKPGFGIQFPFFFSPGNRCGFSQSGVLFPREKSLPTKRSPKFLRIFLLWPGVEKFRWKKQNREQIHGKFSGSQGKPRGFGDSSTTPKPHFLNFPWNSLREVESAPPSPFSPGLCPLGVGILPLPSLRILFFGIIPVFCSLSCFSWDLGSVPRHQAEFLPFFPAVIKHSLNPCGFPALPGADLTQILPFFWERIVAIPTKPIPIFLPHRSHPSWKRGWEPPFFSGN